MTAPDLAKLAALVDACRAADEARHPYEWGTAVDPRGYGNALIAYDDALVALSLEWRDIAALVAAAQARDPAVTITAATRRLRPTVRITERDLRRAEEEPDSHTCPPVMGRDTEARR